MHRKQKDIEEIGSENVSLIFHCLYLEIGKIIANQQIIFLCIMYFSNLFFIQVKLIKYSLCSRHKDKYTRYTEAKDTIVLVPYKNKK